jgi:hypothetical protein
MNSQRFIFSERKNDRIWRHMLFWSVWTPYFILLHMAAPMLKPEASNFNNIPFTATEGFLVLAFQVPITYITLYLIMPIYTQQNKFARALVLLVAAWCAQYFFYQFAFRNLFPVILNGLLPEKYLQHTQRPENLRHFMATLAVFLGAMTSTTFVAGFKYIKQWYLKEQKNIQLQKENAESQLQLLTAQVHPHFLFNTLNNIYSQTQTESPKGSKMIMELSDVLRYILAEGSKELVPVQKELAMIQEYMNLEKIRYGNKLDLHLYLPDDSGNLKIAPLLLLPFVENCFKHGASGLLSRPWVNLKIEINGRELYMKLMNGKSPDQAELHPRSCTGMENVRKRLALLYPGKHELEIVDESEVFVVNLRLELASDTTPKTITETEPKLFYA